MSPSLSLILQLYSLNCKSLRDNKLSSLPQDEGANDSIYLRGDKLVHNEVNMYLRST